MSRSQHGVLLRLAAIACGVVALTLSGVALAGNDTYHYDVYGRLISIIYADGSTITYTYDAAGNRTVVTQTATP